MGRLHRHVSERQWPARASKTRVRQRQHEGSLREVRGGTSIGATPGTPSTVVVPGVSSGGTCYGAYGMLWAKAFAYIAGSDDGGVLGCRFPRWGVILDIHPYGLGSLSENPVQFSGRVTVAPLASCPPWRHRLLRPNSALALLVTTAHGRLLSVVVSSGLVQVGELHGGCKARAVAFAPLVAVRGYLTLSVWLPVADRGGWRC